MSTVEFSHASPNGKFQFFNRHNFCFLTKSLREKSTICQFRVKFSILDLKILHSDSRRKQNSTVEQNIQHYHFRKNTIKKLKALNI
jgi:hypothetical protein